MSEKHILVLGVGNLLLGDEGAGVRVIEKLEDEYVFSQNVELYDGGTLGLRLLEPLSQADCAILVDIVRAGGAPGTLYRIAEKDLFKKIPYKCSLHELNIVEALIYAEELGKKPETVVIGIEPLEFSACSTELSDPVRSRMEDIVTAVLKEIEKAGGSWKKAEQPVRTSRVL
ncbi:MAG: hydrogenase maturation protease [Syntrophobacteraceae bacterium]|nr:hydrogenase maturation protease [Syntrophobacteraceae bacterium]